MAQEITEGAEDSWDAAVRLSEWVGNEITGAVPGGSSAINTLRIREGECGSHSRLLAAFCRAVGIPSRLSVGCLYSPWYGGSFGQHAWTEVYMGEDVGWIMVDATILEFDYVDAGHIKLGELTSFHPNSMEILEYRIDGEEISKDIPEEYKPFIGTYINPRNRNVLEVFYLDGSLTVDILGRVNLALHAPDEEGRMYAKLTNKVYFTFPDGNMHIFENTFAMKRADVEIFIDEGTPEEFIPLLGSYMIVQAQLEFKVSWNDGLKMQPPRVEGNRNLVEFEDGIWKDTVDGKEYEFAMNPDGSVSGMNVLAKSVLIPGTTAYFIVKKTIREEGLDAAHDKFLELWNNRALDLERTEADLNSLGYEYLGEDKIEEALMVFELNVETFPESWNVYDSYGEALIKNGNKEAAIENYSKSIEMNPENENGKAMLEKITLKEGE
jgi:tetratricopeptide (TPR) repeat protein